MNSSTYQLAATMVNQFNRFDTVSHNLANTNTAGYKQELLAEGSFNHYLNRAKNDGSALDNMNKLTNTIPKIDQKYINPAQGELQVTSNALDFALTTPDTFFKVQKPNGDIEYTRDGSFKNLNGFLVNQNGDNVLSGDNEAIVVEGDFANLVGVVQTDFSNLEKVGDNNYKVKNLAQMQFLDNNMDVVVQGSIEKSNVNSVTSMVGLIEASKAMEITQKAYTAKSELNQKLMDKVGGNR